ncbi:MAG: hypothetical protein ACPGVB_10655 [Chitinophagales bacterium]
MKQFLILFACVFCLISIAPHQVVAQNNNNTHQFEKADSTKYQGILGSQTHSGSECGHNRAYTGDKTHYRIYIVDLDLTKSPVYEGQTMSYQANIRTEINAPYKKSHTFKFKKNGQGKFNPNWYIDVPCYAENATFTIDMTYRDKKSGEIKPLKINPQNGSNQMKLKVDFTKGKIYTPDQSKKLLGSFNRKLSVAESKSNVAGLKVKVE